MSNTTTSPYMSLVLPIPGIETGPQYAIEIDAAFTTVDSHTHIPGQGLPVPTLGLNINADLTINGFNLINIRSSRYTSQASPLALSSDLNAVYVSGGNLFFNDGLGNQIQMTILGAVNTSGSGNISGMGATTASAVYTNINHTFSFFSNTNTPAFFNVGPLSISTNTASPNAVTLTTSGTIPAPYTLTFPDALPSAQALVTVDNTGQEVYVQPDNTTTGIVGGKLVAFLPPGVIIAYGGLTVPFGWLLCDGTAVSRSTYSDLYNAILYAYGNGNGTTTFNLPDCRGLFLRGVSGTSGNDPDAASRTASAPGGFTGNSVGTIQSGEFTSHTHIQNAHNHLQDAHNHTQNTHQHTAEPHTHIQDAHFHYVPGYSGSGAIGPTFTGAASPTYTTPVTSNTVAVNQNATVTIDGTVATNQPTTATNQPTTATNQTTGGAETQRRLLEGASLPNECQRGC